MCLPPHLNVWHLLRKRFNLQIKTWMQPAWKSAATWHERRGPPAWGRKRQLHLDCLPAHQTWTPNQAINLGGPIQFGDSEWLLSWINICFPWTDNNTNVSLGISTVDQQLRTASTSPRGGGKKSRHHQSCFCRGDVLWSCCARPGIRAHDKTCLHATARRVAWLLRGATAQSNNFQGASE